MQGCVGTYGVYVPPSSHPPAAIHTIQDKYRRLFSLLTKPAWRRWCGRRHHGCGPGPISAVSSHHPRDPTTPPRAPTPHGQHRQLNAALAPGLHTSSTLQPPRPPGRPSPPLPLSSYTRDLQTATEMTCHVRTQSIRPSPQQFRVFDNCTHISNCIIFSPYSKELYTKYDQLEIYAILVTYNIRGLIWF